MAREIQPTLSLVHLRYFVPHVRNLVSIYNRTRRRMRMSQYHDNHDCQIVCSLFLRWVYTQVLTGDGNFKADHVQHRNPAPDVWLSEGGGMMGKREDYARFLAMAQAQKKVSTVAQPWLAFRSYHSVAHLFTESPQAIFQGTL